MRMVALAAATALTLSGCYTVGTHVERDDASQFEKGVTTEADVVRSFGEPQLVTSKTDGTRTITYSWAHARVKGTTFIPIVQLFASGAKVEAKSTTFVFGQDGKLSEVVLSESTTDSRNYVGGADVRTKTTTSE